MQSEAIILIELLNIFFIDNTHLVLALADILHEEIFSSFRVQTCPKSGGGGGGGGGGQLLPLPTPPSSTPVKLIITKCMIV